jgi:hypothetical protein
MRDEYPSLHPPTVNGTEAAFPTRLPTPKAAWAPTTVVDLAEAEELAEMVASLEPLTLHEEGQSLDTPDENNAERAILRLLNGSKPEMQKLRHIGEQRAEEIVKFREQHGPLTSLDQLHEIGLKAFKPRAFLDANINAPELSSH